MASNDEKRNDLPVQIDLEEISLKLKIWKSLIASADPYIRQEMSAETLFEQCEAIGKIFDKMPKYQLRLLALQLSGSLPDFSSKENELYLTNLAKLSLQWRELYMQLNRWHAQLQTAFLKPSGFRRHCKTLENELRRFGDEIFSVQQMPTCSAFAFEPLTSHFELKRLREQLVSFTARMNCYWVCLAAMKHGPITSFREKQLQDSRQELTELESLLDLEKERFWQISRRMGMVAPREGIITNSTKSRENSDRTKERHSFSEESSGEAAMIWEQNYKHDLKEIMEVPESAKELRLISSPSSSVVNRSEKGQKNSSSRLQALLLSTLPLDILFLGTLLILIMFLCPTWDRFSLCNSFDSLAITWSRRWTGLPPS